MAYSIHDPYSSIVQNYTQNIDTLETLAGVRSVLQCHGSFATASCLNCRVRLPGNAIEADILKGEVPICKACADNAKSTQLPQKRKRGKRKSKGKKKNPFEEADTEEEEIVYPPYIMKVREYYLYSLCVRTDYIHVLRSRT